MIIIRFRTKDGMFRINADEDGDFLLVLEQLVTKISTSDNQSIQISDKPNAPGEAASSLCGRTPRDLGLKNGDMLFVTYDSGNPTNNTSQTQPLNPPPGTVALNSTAAREISTAIKTLTPLNVSELPIDQQLEKEDGLIHRQKSRMCRHGDKGMCEYCSPLPPWDKDYRKEHAIKHMSYHAYLKEINDSKNNPLNGSSYIAPLEEPNYNIDLGCTQGHAPYPKGICSKCQPSSITLQLQKFRMVDHVEFADSTILNNFIEIWRQTGIQRFGVLYGRYEKFEKVPLGIKAVVEAIYEPPQHGESDGVTLLEWDSEQQVDEIAEKLGLYQVGVTFTDLTDSGNRDGTVLCKRHKDSYFLTNLEILMAARNQNKHSNKTRFSNDGVFSSKYVTCVISGGLKGEIEPRSYQVSTSAEALVRADIITASTQPSKLFVNPTSDQRYVPDINYSEVNEYGLEVKLNAKPAFPVDFLLVSLSDSFPLDPKPMFQNKFVIENRDFMGELQDLHKVRDYLHSNSDGTQLCDFHFLVYLSRTNILGPQEFSLLLKFVNERNEQDYLHLMESPGWMTLLTILEQS
jgi:nuclear protein localization family protein 4